MVCGSTLLDEVENDITEFIFVTRICNKMINTEKYFVGIDVGTTNAKCIVINETAEIIAQKSCEYSVDSPNPGWAEQDPEKWWINVWDLCIDVISRLKDKQNINSIGISGQMHGLVTLDKNLRSIRPAILWNDQRSVKECDFIIDQAGGLDDLLSITNNNMLTGYTGSKIIWLQNNEKENCRKIYKILLPKDYVRLQMTGELLTDITDASGTGLFDVKNRCWAESLINRLNIPREWFPVVAGSMEKCGYLKPQLAKTLGLDKKIPVITGAGDAVIQPLGSGILDSSEGLLVIGTGGNVTVQLPGYMHNKAGNLQIFCGIFPGTYVAMGVTLSAGDSLKWLRDLLQTGIGQLNNGSADITFAEISDLAGKSSPGAGNLLFLPYLSGERCPYPDHLAKGSFIGLNTKTSLSDIVRAVLEGVSFSLKDVTLLIEQSGVDFKSLFLSGGGARSELWRQILADIFDKKIATVSTSAQGSAFGAALLAGLSENAWSSPSGLKRLIPVTSEEIPDNERVATYNKLFSAYQQGYPQLKPIFNLLS